MRVDSVFANARAAGIQPISFEMFRPKASSPSIALMKSHKGSHGSHPTL